MKKLLAQGAIIDLVDNQNATALNIAADQRRSSVLQAFLDAGADIRHRGRIGPALTEAVGSRSVECAKILLENGGNPNGEEDDDFLWPLIVASDQGDMIDLLLKHGADPNKCSAIKLTAPHFAARHGNAETIRKLIAGGARVDTQLSDGSLIDPLYYAIQEQAEDAVAELLFRGADPNASYANGKSPLMLAAGVGNAKIVNALLDSGADLHRKEIGIKTALDFANQAGKKVVIKLLTERLAGKW